MMSLLSLIVLESCKVFLKNLSLPSYLLPSEPTLKQKTKERNY
jgi:hypothetical protein